MTLRVVTGVYPGGKFTGKLIQPGDFAAVRNHGSAVANLIHFAEILDGGFKDFEHAIVYVGGPKDLILEAEPGGAKLLPFREASIAQYDCLWSTINPELDLTLAQRRRVPAVCDALKGTPYSAVDYFAIAGHRLHIPDLPIIRDNGAHLLADSRPQWVTLKDYIADSNHMICSQLADYVRLLLGSHLYADNRWPGYVTPADIGAVILG